MMEIKTQDSEFHHPETAAHLQSLTDEEARRHPPIVRESGGVAALYWHEGGEVRCREVGAGEASAGRATEMEALLAAAEREFGGLLPRLKAEFGGGGVPDLDAFETSICEGLFACGATGYAALLEAFEAKLPTPCCQTCGEPMERHSRRRKTFQSRFGPLRIKRTYCFCRARGDGCYPLDVALGLEGRTITPGAESLCADVASSDSCETASRKLRNLAGVDIPKTTLRNHSMRIGQEVQTFEREDAEAETPAADRVLPGTDGTGVPARANEVEGVAGKQEDGTAETREAKTIVRCTADSRDPKTGEPRKDKGSGAVSVRIDSAQSAGAGRTSDFAARLCRFGTRNGLFEAKELVVLSDGAAWIRKVCEEVFAGRNVTFILDLFHALEYAAAAERDLPPGESGRTAWMDWIKDRLAAGRVGQVIAELKPHRRRSEAVAACIDYFEVIKGWMRVRRVKALSPSGCESRPATDAPAGSNRSGSWRQRHGLKHFEAKGPRRRLSDRAGRNASGRRAGLETPNAGSGNEPSG